MPTQQTTRSITLLDVSQFSYAERVCAAALQGLVNHDSPTLYLDYGVYDDPSARRTNEVFLDDRIWVSKYRQLLGNQDQRNLEYYRQLYQFSTARTTDLAEIITRHREQVKGLVIWDEDLPDSVNIAVMLAARRNLLPVTSVLAETHAISGIPVIEDLRGRWKDRVALYQWAFQNLFEACKPGHIACVEPGWQRPEFIDYIVQNNLFTYSLSSTSGGLGSKLLLLLAFGPPNLREFLFAFHLEGLIRKFALTLMSRESKEVALSNKIQRAVKALPYPTIFGWHTRSDDELSFMLQLSSNGLRLVPAHLAGNFSFHSRLPAAEPVSRLAPPEPILDPQGVYLTFTLSDGDQLMMMHTGELGNWYSPLRGRVPFNWEVQPLLSEIAPALLQKFTSLATPNDCLIAGPSGAGYIVPPLAPSFDAYMDDTARICARCGIDVITTYVADPPGRVLRTLARHRGGLTGTLAGYAVVTRAPAQEIAGFPVVANRLPGVNQIWLDAPDLLIAVKAQASRPQSLPAFIGVHLFAYRTTYEDVVRFVDTLTDEHIHVVRADEFLHLFQQFRKREKDEH